MKQGSSRFGNDFETKSREFVAKYGFDIVEENKIIKCSIEKSHMKPSHEIDFIVNFDYSSNKLPLPHLNGFSKKFLISCKSGNPLNQSEIEDAKKQYECVKADPRFSDVEGAVIICNSIQPNLKLDDKIKIWDSTYMHLLGEKMRIARRVLNSKQMCNEYQIKDEGVSAIWQIGNSVDPVTNSSKIVSEINIFNENYTKDIGKTEVFKILNEQFKEDASITMTITKIIKIYSASGVRTDLKMLINTFDQSRPNQFFSKITDLSTATWTLYLEDTLI